VAAGQQPDEVRLSSRVYVPRLVLSAESRLVQFEVVVRDAHGRPVSGLKRDDFAIFDEGQPRPIAAFSVETRPAGVSKPENAHPEAVSAAQPHTRSTLLFFDDLHSDTNELRRTQAAAGLFVGEGLGPGATAAVYAASEGLLLDFTADRGALIAAIGKLHTHQRMSESGMQSCPRITPYQAYLIDNNLDPNALQAALREAQSCGPIDPSLSPSHARSMSGGQRRGTSMTSDPIEMAVRLQAAATWQQAYVDSLASLDAIENALALLARAPESRVLLMVSGGFLSSMLDAERSAAMDRAIQAGIVINALDAKGVWVEPPGRPFDETLHNARGFPLETFLFESATAGMRNNAVNDIMADFAAGTGGLFFHNSNNLAGGFEELGAVPETAYLIAFRPAAEAATGKYRRLKVQLAAAGNNCVQTRPGYFAPAAMTGAPAGSGKRDYQALATDDLREIPIRLAGMLGRKEKGEPVISLFVHADIGKLSFAKREGRHTQKLIFIAALLDSDGNLAGGREVAMELALKDATFTRLSAGGVDATVRLDPPPGMYRVRVVVEDANGKMGTATQTVEIPK
jgi:VWFA-related protein